MHNNLCTSHCCFLCKQQRPSLFLNKKVGGNKSKFLVTHKRSCICKLTFIWFPLSVAMFDCGTQWLTLMYGFFSWLLYYWNEERDCATRSISFFFRLSELWFRGIGCRAVSCRGILNSFGQSDSHPHNASFPAISGHSTQTSHTG